ncbi:MAG: hypothetical protein R6T92_06885, partial [Desulfosalsimonadaceae bacterium]
RNQGDNLAWDEILMTNDGIYNAQLDELVHVAPEREQVGVTARLRPLPPKTSSIRRGSSR